MLGKEVGASKSGGGGGGGGGGVGGGGGGGGGGGEAVILLQPMAVRYQLILRLIMFLSSSIIITI